MTWVITWAVDCGDGVYIERGRPSTTLQTTPHRTMTNAELTLDQLQAVAGGATAIEYGLMAACVPTLNTTALTRPKTELKTAVSNANT